MKVLFNIALFLIYSPFLISQSDLPFKIEIEKLAIDSLPALQSYAWAKSGTKILLVGGRTDGLHKRQPFASFNKQFNNTNLIVWDVELNKIWKLSVNEFPNSIAEQLQSSNMEFYQDGNILWLVGGYGYSESKKTHRTYPSIIGIKVEELIHSIVSGSKSDSFIAQIEDTRMAVTGGRMHKHNGKLYLVGGQRFDGRYNPHGPDHGPGFLQEYTNEIRMFNITWTNNNIQIINYTAKKNDDLLHRRDYNLLPQIDRDGKEMLTIFSGVFRYDKDLPYTSLIDIKNEEPAEVNNFSQKFCHYHTANLSMHSRFDRSQYSVFFGGIAQFTPGDKDSILSDENVPFVKTISVIKRNSSGTIEYSLPQSMNGFFGSAAEFIPYNNASFSKFGILELDKLTTNKTLVGYIIGGIGSTEPNVFWSNTPENNFAAPYIWKVYLSNTSK